MAFIAGPDENSMIMLAEFPASLAGDEAQMQQQMRDAFANQTGTQNMELEFVSSEDVTINDAAATLATYEGTDSQGNNVRQILGVFEAKSGEPGHADDLRRSKQLGRRWNQRVSWIRWSKAYFSISPETARKKSTF
jgi:hypothetical protein